jgi:hypothetical protein
MAQIALTTNVGFAVLLHYGFVLAQHTFVMIAINEPISARQKFVKDLNKDVRYK